MSPRRKVHHTVATVTHNADNDVEDVFRPQLHELAMQTEMRKREKDIGFLKKRMRYTFQQRKEWIALNHPKVAEIVKQIKIIFLPLN